MIPRESQRYTMTIALILFSPLYSWSINIAIACLWNEQFVRLSGPRDEITLIWSSTRCQDIGCFIRLFHQSVE